MNETARKNDAARSQWLLLLRQGIQDYCGCKEIKEISESFEMENEILRMKNSRMKINCKYIRY